MQKKAGTFDRRGRDYYEKVEDSERQREGVLHCKKKKNSSLRKGWELFGRREEEGFDSKSWDFFIFIFMIKNQQRKCILKMAELFRKENSDARYI